MDSTDAPVSTAVELATLAINAFRYFAGTLRCGLVLMSGFFFIIALLASTIVPPDLKTGYLKVRAFAGRI